MLTQPDAIQLIPRRLDYYTRVNWRGTLGKVEVGKKGGSGVIFAPRSHTEVSSRMLHSIVSSSETITTHLTLAEGVARMVTASLDSPMEYY